MDFHDDPCAAQDVSMQLGFIRAVTDCQQVLTTIVRMAVHVFERILPAIVSGINSITPSAE